jgi:UDP-3-O-[3-hydroxymyristoyl] glucosamine N-acyltransferase LpxD
MPKPKVKREDLKPGENLCEYCTAKCCRYFALPIDTPADRDDFNHIRWYMMHGNVSIFVEDDTWFLMVLADCKHLLPDNRCGTYDTRPGICRKYTTVNCEYDDDATYENTARATQAGAVLVKPDLAEHIERAAILVDFPVAAMNAVIERLGLAPKRPAPGVHPTAVIDPANELPADIRVGPFAVIGAQVTIGSRCVIGPHVTIECGVTMGNDCTIDPGAVLHEGARLGNGVVIGTGAVISRQGFGFTPTPTGPLQIHHVGTVTIGDQTRIGAHCNIDRGRFGPTSIGTMCGFDYGVHLGHNCTIGDRCFIAAQAGLAGHATVGNDCQVGGQAGFSHNGRVGDRCGVGAQSGINKDFGDDRKLFGTLAEDYALSMRMQATLRRLAQPKKHRPD